LRLRAGFAGAHKNANLGALHGKGSPVYGKEWEKSAQP